jgi:hypothetical protein
VAKSPQAVRFKKKLPQLPKREVFTEEISSKYPVIFWLLDAFQKSGKKQHLGTIGICNKTLLILEVEGDINIYKPSTN